MNFQVEEAVEVLARTPTVLAGMLSGLSEAWLSCNEGEGTWNPAEVIAHLIEGERHNWMPRLAFILREGDSRPFPAFDRYAHLNAAAADRTVERQLLEFQTLRECNLAALHELLDPARQLEQTGLHPSLGVVKVRELLSAWVVHDFTHLAQIVRVMAKRYSADVGPFRAFLSILK